MELKLIEHGITASSKSLSSLDLNQSQGFEIKDCSYKVLLKNFEFIHGTILQLIHIAADIKTMYTGFSYLD